MKKTLIALGLAAAFVGAQTKTAEARGFNPVGAVIGGVVAGAVIADAFAPHPVYVSAPAPAYCPPPAPVYYAAPVVYAQPQVVYAPAPVVVYHEPFVRVGFGFGRSYRYHGHYR